MKRLTEYHFPHTTIADGIVKQLETIIQSAREKPQEEIATMEQDTIVKEPRPEGRPALRPADPSKMVAGGNPDALNIVRPGSLTEPARKPGRARTRD